MRRTWFVVVLALLSLSAAAQTAGTCSCGSNPPGRPATRSAKPYANEPPDMRPWSKFGEPYYEHYTNLVEYNGAARDLPDGDLSKLSEIRIGFLGPVSDHREQTLGNRMLNGAQLAISEANGAGGYCGKPFHLVIHNDYNNWQDTRTAVIGPSKDSAIWGAASNDAVRMIYDDKVWAMFGSISSESTHIALRLTLKAETPMVNSSSTDPTVPETTIPWYFSDLQDDRQQGYTLARRIYTELGFKRVALLRVNDRYGRFGVGKFRDASRRLGHPVVIEQKFMPGDTDYRRQLQVIQDSRVDAIVLWTDVIPAANILLQMKELGMKQRVFGSHRTMSDELPKLAGPAAEGFEAVFPYDASRREQAWLDFNTHYEAQYHAKPDHFASLAYDAMQILLKSICQAGLNRGRIRDALTGITSYKGVTGEMQFDPNCKNVSPLFLATVHNGAISYRKITMEKIEPYARVGEDGVQYAGPALPDLNSEEVKIGVFGEKADQAVKLPEVAALLEKINGSGRHVSLIALPTEGSWGQASTALVQAVYKDKVFGIIATDRKSSHLAEQIGVKGFVPVVALSSDKTLTSTNIPWIFRLPEDTPLAQAVQVFLDAEQTAGANREKIRDALASGRPLAGVRFQSTGEAQ